MVSCFSEVNIIGRIAIIHDLKYCSLAESKDFGLLGLAVQRGITVDFSISFLRTFHSRDDFPHVLTARQCPCDLALWRLRSCRCPRLTLQSKLGEFFAVEASLKYVGCSSSSRGRFCTLSQVQRLWIYIYQSPHICYISTGYIQLRYGRNHRISGICVAWPTCSDIPLACALHHRNSGRYSCDGWQCIHPSQNVRND